MHAQTVGGTGTFELFGALVGAIELLGALLVGALELFGALLGWESRAAARINRSPGMAR